MTLGDERRALPRENCYAKIRIERGNFTGNIDDINDQGCRVIAVGPQRLDIGTAYDFTICYENDGGPAVCGESCAFHGDVRWLADESGFTIYGLRVLSFLTETDGERFRALVAYYSAT